MTISKEDQEILAEKLYNQHRSSVLKICQDSVMPLWNHTVEGNKAVARECVKAVLDTLFYLGYDIKNPYSEMPSEKLKK